MLLCSFFESRITGKSAQKVPKRCEKPVKKHQKMPIFAKKASIFAKNTSIFCSFSQFFTVFFLPILPNRYNPNGYPPAFLIVEAGSDIARGQNIIALSAVRRARRFWLW
jgi:hypothetical protein